MTRGPLNFTDAQTANRWEITRRAEELLEAMPEGELDRSPKEIYQALLRRLATAPDGADG